MYCVVIGIGIWKWKWKCTIFGNGNVMHFIVLHCTLLHCTELCLFVTFLCNDGTYKFHDVVSKIHMELVCRNCSHLMPIPQMGSQYGEHGESRSFLALRTSELCEMWSTVHFV